MLKYPNRLWLVVLVLGLAFDFLFWKQAPGIAFLIFVCLCLVGGFIFLGMEKLAPAWKSLLLLVPILFFAAMTFIRQEQLTVFLAFVLTLFCMGVLAITFRGGRWLEYRLADYASRYFHLLGSMIARPLQFIIESRKQHPLEAGTHNRSHRIWPVLRGILIALPVVAIFAALLASADLIFAQRLNDFVAVFRLEKFPEYIFRGVYILVGAYLLAGVFMHAAAYSLDEKLIGEEKQLVPSFLGFTEATIVLGSVVLLFTVFVAIQFQYFFGGQTNIYIDGYTYAEYARRGFGELVAVAFISLLLFLGLSAITRRETINQRRAFSGLGIALVVLVGVMLVSAFQRLLLYEAAYGFSRLRSYTHVFVIWLGLLLVAVVILEILRRPRYFATAMLLAVLGFATTLSLLNVDGFIARQNVARASDSEDLDVGYLASLSADAIPTLASLFQSPALPVQVRDAVGASLACLSYNTGGSTGRPDDWRSFHLSNYLGEKALQSILNDLKLYEIDDGDWPVQVTSPAGTTYSCSSGYID